MIFTIEIYAGFGMSCYKWEVIGENECEALDTLIDTLRESEENNHLFDDKHEHNDDEILIGGNCSDRLITYGMFAIKPFKDIEDENTPSVRLV